MRRSICILLMAFLTVPAAGPVFAGDSGAGMDLFQLMELRQHIRENPNTEQSRRDRFTLGEQYFRRGMTPMAVEALGPLHVKSPRERMEILVSAYLLLSARRTGDTKTIARIERELQDTLSSRQFVGTFRPEQVQAWRSPTGNRYVFRETVDRMEITLNEKAFYTIDLS